MPFKDRTHAAQQLAGRLECYRGCRPLVLAIPRGALPMGQAIASALDGELDVILVHKLAAPYNPELAIGAVGENGTVLLNDNVEAFDIGKAYVNRETQRQIGRLRRRRVAYAHPSLDPKGRVVIVVDDGSATGSTMLTALRLVRACNPKTLLAALAVAPPQSLLKIQQAADEVICLETPEDFISVNQFFEDFSQVSDREAIRILNAELSQEKP